MRKLKQPPPSHRSKLQDSDCKDLAKSYNDSFARRPGSYKALAVEFLKDDPQKGPLYTLKSENGTLLAYGWFGADGNAKFIKQ